MKNIIYPKENPFDPNNKCDSFTERDKMIVNALFVFIWKLLYGSKDSSSVLLAVVNNREGNVPYFNVSSRGIPHIVLAVKDFSFWCQVAFQFSHEFSHWAMYEKQKEMDEKQKEIYVPASWVEEIIAESFSLFVLKKLQMSWKYCELSEQNMYFSECIRCYLNDILRKEGTGAIENCDTIPKLEKLNQTSESNRENHFEEVKKLFYLLDEKNVFGLFDYKRFCYPSSFLFDESKYRTEYSGNPAVAFVCDLQRNIYKRAEFKGT